MADFNKTYIPIKVLISPLDWGLGHAARCAPLIRELELHGCKVFIATGKGPATLLRGEFPELQFLEIPGYNIRYSRNKWILPFKLLAQLPGIFWSIRKEHVWLDSIITHNQIDIVISDNRPGLSTNKIPCVYITHQLNIKAGFGIFEKILQRIHYHFIKKFSFCWVPDFAGNENMAGELSHPPKLPGNEKYIGCLSRLENQFPQEKKYDFLAIISGPEPQRSVFEKIVVNQFRKLKGVTMFLLRGLPGNDCKKPEKIPGLTVTDHITAAELEVLISQAKFVISRSGYTTIMDLVKLQKKALLVPTPGQTEQEYLAKYLSEKKLFACMHQADLDLQKAVSLIEETYLPSLQAGMHYYKSAILELLENVR